MKKVLAILCHPIVYFCVVKDLEMMVLFNCACTLLDLPEPTVWEVDKINEMTNSILYTMRSSPDCIGNNRNVKSCLFWTRLILKFRDVTVSRDTTWHCLDLYNNATKVISKENVTLDDALAAHMLMVKKFEYLV